MKVGIITQALLNNYGGILQNYALQQVLKEMGHSPVTIDYVSHFPVKKYIIYTLKTCYLLLRKKKRKFLSYYRKRNRFNQQFVGQNLNTTRPTKKYASKLLTEYGIKALVVGSDQVWRPAYNNDLYDMYLSFAYNNDDIIKISYAASFGVDKWIYSKKQTKKCTLFTKKFDAISVREFSGIELCKNNLDAHAVQVLDPTLLLKKEKYEELCKDVPEEKSSFLAAYMLDLNNEKEVFIKDIGYKYNLSIKYFRADNNASLSIQEWLAVFRDAKFVITDSFHGTLFSIIFRKEFLALGNKKRGLSRFKSILSLFNLEHRLIIEPSIYTGSLIPINWDEINQIMNKKINESLSFLCTNLTHNN